MKLKEFDLYEKIENTGPFSDVNFSYEIQTNDWILSRKRIDLVTLKNHKLIAIEVKLHNWKNALQQAYTNLYAVDYSYVALWHKTIPRVDMSIFQNYGIGMLEVNGTCEEKIKARRSKLIIPKRRRYVKGQCKLQGVS